MHIYRTEGEKRYLGYRFKFHRHKNIYIVTESVRVTQTSQEEMQEETWDHVMAWKTRGGNVSKGLFSAVKCYIKGKGIWERPFPEWFQ